MRIEDPVDMEAPNSAPAITISTLDPSAEDYQMPDSFEWPDQELDPQGELPAISMLKISPPTALWEGKHIHAAQWSRHVLQQLDVLGKALISTVPKDYATYCPRYPQLTPDQRKQVWLRVISAMARYESGFRPTLTYRESFYDSSGQRVVSSGLLQISIRSGNYYGCGFRSNRDLLVAEKNLSCGIRILNYWMNRDRRIAGHSGGGWKGGARYWSVLRTSSYAHRSILSLVKNTTLCMN